MKTSNKLLIIIAIILASIPMIMMTYINKKTYKSRDELQKYNQSKLKFEDPTDGFQSKRFDRDFESIIINNASIVTIELIKSDKSGIKVSNDVNERGNFDVNANKELIVQLKRNPNKRWTQETIVIYAPEFSNLEINGAKELILTANLPKLNLTVNKSGTVRLNHASQITDMKIESDSVNEIFADKALIKSLDINQNSGNFYSNNTSYSRLLLNGSGIASFEIAQSEKSSARINKLTVHMTGNNNLTLSNLKIDTLTGSVSDQTRISAPVEKIRKLIQ